MAIRRTKKRPGRGRARIIQSSLPSLFTIGNIFCGYYSLVSTLKGHFDQATPGHFDLAAMHFDQAAIAIFFGWVLDGLDGRVARLTQTTSDFGVQLDSLADMLTFGVAPALLAFEWGLGSIADIQATVAIHVLQFAWVATFAFVICGALRLARFNVQAQKPSESAAKRHFTGLPIPAGAGLVAAFVHFYGTPILLVGSALMWCLLVLLTAGLMISTVRYDSFKGWNFTRHRMRTLFGASMLLALIIFWSEDVLLAITVVYAASGPVAKLSQVVRLELEKRAAAHHAAAGNLKS